MQPIVLTRSRTLVIVSLSYLIAAWGASLLFPFVEQQRGAEDDRAAQVSIAYAGICVCLWSWSVVQILRSRSKISLPPSSKRALFDGRSA